MPRMMAAELLKVRKRWLPYTLLLVLLVGAALQVWLAGYGSWLDERNNPEYGFGEDSLRAFALPWSLPALLDGGQFWGAILVGVFASSLVATEYGWGTVRQAIIRGQTRSQYLTIKLIIIVLASAVGLLVVLGIGVIFSILATNLADRPITLDIPGGGGTSVPEIAVMILRAGYGIVPYGLLAFCLAVVGRSTTLGVAGLLFYVIFEGIMLGILGQLGGPAPAISAFLMGHNVSALLAANRIGEGGYSSLAFRENPQPSDLPEPAIAALVVAAYCLVFLFVAFFVFRRREIRS